MRYSNFLDGKALAIFYLLHEILHPTSRKLKTSETKKNIQKIYI